MLLFGHLSASSLLYTVGMVSGHGVVGPDSSILSIVRLQPCPDLSFLLIESYSEGNVNTGVLDLHKLK